MGGGGGSHEHGMLGEMKQTDCLANVEHKFASKYKHLGALSPTPHLRTQENNCLDQMYFPKFMN